MKADHAGRDGHMYIGTSIFMIALGAILKFAVTATVAGFSIQTAGTILIVAGAVGLIASLLLEVAAADRRGPRDVEVVREREPVVRERY
jgi:hypothetical protein